MLFEHITVVGEDYTAREDQYLLVEGAHIRYLGAQRPADYQGAVYDGRNKIVMPGFINTHCHAAMTLLRGYGEGLPLQRWLTEKMFPFEALLTGEDIYWGAMLGIAEMMRSGAVSFTDMYVEMEAMCRAVEESGIKANLSHGCSSATPETRFPQVNGYAGLRHLMEYSAKMAHGRMRCEASIHAEYTSSEPLVRDIAAFAKEHGLPIHLHLSESQAEHEECKRRRGGMTPAQWFEYCGVFDVPVNAAHCVWVEDCDIEILARHGATAMHCPSANLKLGSGIAPIKRLLDGGVNVTIATDGPASNNNLNMLEEVSLASLLQKGSERDPLFMSTTQTLTLACKNGAKAQGRADCGCIKVGNRADLVVYNLDTPATQPVFDPIANVLYAAQASDVLLTMIDGTVVYQDGEYKTIDIDKVKYQVAKIAKAKSIQLEK